MEDKKIFDKKFVHCMWTDELEGKSCIVSDSIDIMIDAIENGTYLTDVINRSKGGGYALHSNKTGSDYAVAYYDPLYSIKWAWKQGKIIQGRLGGKLRHDWMDIENPCWLDGYEYRVKPDDKFKLIQHSDTNKLELVSADVRTEDDEVVCYGTKEECTYHMVRHYCNKCNKQDASPCPYDYCTGFVSKKKWRPFKDIQELKDTWDDKQGLQQGLRLVYPELVEPVIWVREKQSSISRMVRDFDYNRGMVHIGHWCSLEYLFNTFEFLDGTPCGVEE